MARERQEKKAGRENGLEILAPGGPSHQSTKGDTVIFFASRIFPASGAPAPGRSGTKH